VAALNGPLLDPGEYTAEITIGGKTVTKKFVMEEDPRVTWFSAGDRAKRRASLNELVVMTKQAADMRKKFTDADAALKALEAAWKKPDAPKIPENVKSEAAALKKQLDDLRPMFAARNFNEAVSPEELKEELARPEPEFRLQPLMQRVTGLIQALESYSAAPSQSQLQQIALVKTAIAGAGQSMGKLSGQVVRFNDAMNAAKVPVIPVP
jgi:hypothetical protein